MTLSTATIDKVNAEIRKMLEWLAENPEGSQYTGEDKETWTRWYEGKLEPEETSINLRFDVADVIGSPKQTGNDLVNFLFPHLAVDLLDLLENGDSGASQNDALLKAFDGVKMRGKEPSEYKIVSGLMYTEYKPKHDAYEYTIYLRPYINWA